MKLSVLLPRFALGLFLFTLPAGMALAGFVLTSEPAKLEQAVTSLHSPRAPLLVSLYKPRAYEPFWDPKAQDYQGSLTSFLDSLILISDGNGLEGLRERAEAIRQLAESVEPRESYKVEAALADLLVKLALDLNGSSTGYAYLFPGWPFTQQADNIPATLREGIEKGTIHTNLAALAPTDLGYLHLIEALKLYRAIEQKGGWPTIAGGETLKPGMTDPRVAQLRTRLEAEAYTLPQCLNPEEAFIYSDSLKQVVMDYQARNGLDADGNVGSKTLAALNLPVSKRIDQIRANMAFVRGLPRTWPERMVLVNIANNSARFFNEGKEILHLPVITGRTDRKTPFIASEIRSVILNPAWNVPAKIAREDILPKLRKDPHYLEKMGFVIKGSADDPHGTQIDWQQIERSEFTFRLRQAPGEMNALGPIKFDFDNDFAVYMHGTPHTELFAKTDRHLSSGCVRVKDPEKVAAFILEGTPTDWSEEKVKEGIAQQETRWIKVGAPLPVFFVYQTAFFPTDSRAIHFRPDRYGYDRILLQAMSEKD